VDELPLNAPQPETAQDAMLAQARQRLDDGRVAASNGDFTSASTILQQAQSILDVAPADAADQPIQHLRDQIADTALVVGLAEQAEIERSQGQHERALAAVHQAVQQLKQLRDVPEIATVVQALQQTITGEYKRIRDEEQQITTGERLLAQRSLDKAASRFKAACNALLPETRRRAEERLRYVEQEIQSFEEDVHRAGQTSDLFAATEAWQRAYDRWPSERGVTASLADALASAGEAALSDGHEEIASGYINRALALIAKHPKATAALQLLERAEQIRVAITRVRDQFDQLTRRGIPTSGDDAGLRTQLAQLTREANNVASLRNEITALLEELDQRQQHWRTIALADEQATQLVVAGDWEQALRIHAQALAVLGDPLPALATRRHTAWQDAWTACVTAEREGLRLLNNAQATYEIGRNADDFALVVAQITQIDQVIDLATHRTQTIGIPLPNTLQSLSTNANILRRRAESAALAMNTGTVQQGLSSIRESIRVLGEDPTLSRIEQALTNQRTDQVPGLLRQAQQAEEQEAFDDALDYIRQAREIDPDDPGLAERLDQLNRRRRFEEALRSAERAVEVAGSSLTGERDALRKALEVFLQPEFAVVDATRTTIRELIALGDEESGEALANPDKLRQARELREQLLTHEGWVDRRAAQLTEQWMLVAREAALRSLISSLAAIGEMLGAYRTAYNYRRIYQNEESIFFLEQTQEQLRQRLIEQADKLLSRARVSLDEGEYASALDNLDSLERNYYEPIEKEFPFLLDTLDEGREISKSRLDAQELRKQAEQLGQQAETIRQAVQAAESAFLANQFVEADQTLQAIIHDDRLKSLKQFAVSLGIRIERSRKQQARRQLDDQLVRARTTLRTETDHQRLDDLLTNLEQFSRQLDWFALEADDRTEFNTMVDQISETRSVLATIAFCEDDANQARRIGDNERAKGSLQKAINAAQESNMLQLRSRAARLQAEYDDLERMMRRQHTRDEAIQQGRQLLGIRNFAGAIESFALAQSFGADVDALQRMARAGELLHRARTAWEAKQDLESARDDLDLARELAKHNPEAQFIMHELDFYESQIKQRLSDIQIALQNTQAALSQDDLQTAETHVRTILAWNTTQPEALRLEQELQIRIKNRSEGTLFRTLIERTEEERKRGNDRTALTFLEDALKLRPDDPLAINMHIDLVREHEANEVLRKARAEVYNGKFLEAHRLIQIAEVSASPLLLAEVRRLIEDLEAAYRANTIYPIRDLLRDERYRDALRRCTETLKYVESDHLRADLTDLVSTIVRRWVEKSIALAQGKLRNADEERAREITVDLQKMKEDLAAYPESEQFVHWIRQANIGRLNIRLTSIEAFLRQRTLLYQTAEIEPSDLPTPDTTVAGPLTLQNAQEQANEALAEASAMKLDQLSIRARALLQAIDERMRFEQFQEARLLLNRASTRPTHELASENLAQARILMQSVVAHERFRNDRKAIELLDQINRAQTSLEQTRDEISRAEESLKYGRFGDAQHQLRRVNFVYPLLQPRYTHMSTLLDRLVRAEQQADKREWRDAITLYREAAQLEPNLESLSSKIGYCQGQITDEIYQESSIVLRAPSPDTEMAQSQLNEAEAAGWLDSTASTKIAGLRRWIASRKRAVDAILLLDPAHAEPERALVLFGEAQQIYSDPQSDELIDQWIILAQALQDWHTHKLNEAYQSLKRILPPVVSMPYVRIAQRIIQDQLLTELCGQVSQALAVWDTTAATQSIRRGLQIAPDNPQLASLSIRHQQIMQEADELRKLMETGCKALERTPNEDASAMDDLWSHIQEAQQAFDQALQIDEQFAEASQWLHFAQAIERGLRMDYTPTSASFEARGRLFEEARQLFEAAVSALESEADQPRPVLLGGAKRQQDRRTLAIDHAAELMGMARVLAKLCNDAHSYEQQQDLDRILPAIAEIERQQQVFEKARRKRIVLSTQQQWRSPKPESNS